LHSKGFCSSKNFQFFSRISSFSFIHSSVLKSFRFQERFLKFFKIFFFSNYLQFSKSIGTSFWRFRNFWVSSKYLKIFQVFKKYFYTSEKNSKSLSKVFRFFSKGF
jgi:hypothetical protein